MFNAAAYLEEVLLLRYTFFGLPFVCISILLPFLTQTTTASLSLSSIVLILVAFFALRVAGMSLNRVVDCDIDALNPRTATRALPQGLLSKNEVLLVSFLSFGLFFLACRCLNETTFCLSFIPAVLVGVYSFTKRFTSLCHFALGLVHCFIPIIISSALTSEISLASILLGVSQLCMIASGDIYYATQDMEFDRAHTLYSIPARYGKSFSQVAVRFLQLMAILFLVLLGVIYSLSFIYFFSLIVVCMMYGIAAYRNSDMFLINRVIGFVLLLGWLGELVWQKLQ